MSIARGNWRRSRKKAEKKIGLVIIVGGVLYSSGSAKGTRDLTVTGDEGLSAEDAVGHILLLRGLDWVRDAWRAFG